MSRVTIIARRLVFVYGVQMGRLSWGSSMSRRYVCITCSQIIPDRRSSVDLNKCRHCYSKEKYGVLDINDCHQGSIITLEDT